MASNASHKNLFHLVFITAAESPFTSDLLVSQVLEPAIMMAKRRHSVTWLAAVPMLSYLKDKILRLGKLSLLENKCLAEGIKFSFVVLPLSINGDVSFIIKTPILRWAAKYLASRLNLLNKSDNNQPVIFHGRSYYGTALASEIRSLLKGRGYSHCYVSFDMRSLLSEEFPLTHKFFGRFLYGYAKQWEYELLKKSDISFLPLDFAREVINAETGIEVFYAPIQGFDREGEWQVDFEKRWKTRKIGYAGSIGKWHDPLLLKEIIRKIPDSTAELAMVPIPALADFDCKNYLYSDMRDYYDSLLALIIPGRISLNDRFVLNQMRNNLFSTKAAEALSMGVPLIVSSELRELAEFVKKHECGAIYDPHEHKFSFPAWDWLVAKDEWMRISENAYLVGETFTRNKVINCYVSAWKKIAHLK